MRKEIEVWYKMPNEETNNFVCYDHEPVGRPDLQRFKKSKLIIELPEKKVEITESQLDEALKDCFAQGGYFLGKDELKKKLFGEDSKEEE